MPPGSSRVAVVALDVADAAALDARVAEHDLVVSLVPYTLHALVIAACVRHRRHFVSTSYVNPAMQALDEAYAEPVPTRLAPRRPLTAPRMQRPRGRYYGAERDRP